MAAQISCDLCQSEPAAMMQTVLGNGETICVGEACMVTFFAGALQGMLGQLDESGWKATAPALVPLAVMLGPLDNGVSGNESAGALTEADVAQLGPPTATSRIADAVADALQNADDERSEAEA